MFLTLKHRVAALLILIALAVILIPMWVHDASRLKITLWGLPSEPKTPAVPAINQLPVIKLLGDDAQKNNPNAWSLQLGTFASAVQAQQLVDQLRAKDLPAYADHTTVYVGPELTQESLQRLENNLAQNFKIKGSVVTFTAIPAT
jgi:cell division septation protein DedD